VLILALLSQLLAASLTSLVVVRALRGLTDRLLESLPPAGAALTRRWMAAALVAIGVTSGLQLGAGLGAGAALGAWPLLGEGTARWDVSPLMLAGLQAGGAVLGALRGLAFATLFLLGLGVLGGAFGRAQERPPILGRGGEAGRRSHGEPGRRDLSRGPRPGRGDDPRSPGEPRRMPGGGGRGRGSAPDRERGRESFREGSALATHGAGSGVATRYGARPIPDPMAGHAPGAAARGPLRGPGDRFPRNAPPRGRDPVSAMGRSAGNGERRGLSPNEPPPGVRERMGAGDRPLDNEPGG
jgi:hypothetical protein